MRKHCAGREKKAHRLSPAASQTSHCWTSYLTITKTSRHPGSSCGYQTSGEYGWQNVAACASGEIQQGCELILHLVCCQEDFLTKFSGQKMVSCLITESHRIANGWGQKRPLGPSGPILLQQNHPEVYPRPCPGGFWTSPWRKPLSLSNDLSQRSLQLVTVTASCLPHAR